MLFKFESQEAAASVAASFLFGEKRFNPRRHSGLFTQYKVLPQEFKVVTLLNDDSVDLWIAVSCNNLDAARRYVREVRVFGRVIDGKITIGIPVTLLTLSKLHQVFLVLAVAHRIKRCFESSAIGFNRELEFRWVARRMNNRERIHSSSVKNADRSTRLPSTFTPSSAKRSAFFSSPNA